MNQAEDGWLTEEESCAVTLVAMQAATMRVYDGKMTELAVCKQKDKHVFEGYAHTAGVPKSFRVEYLEPMPIYNAPYVCENELVTIAARLKTREQLYADYLRRTHAPESTEAHVNSDTSVREVLRDGSSPGQETVAGGAASDSVDEAVGGEDSLDQPSHSGGGYDQQADAHAA
jgi:hypothetical protein